MKKKILLIVTLFVSMFTIRDEVNASDAMCNKLTASYENVCEYKTFVPIKYGDLAEVIYLYYNDSYTMIDYTSLGGKKTYSLKTGESFNNCLDNIEKSLFCTANFISVSDTSEGCPSEINVYDATYRYNWGGLTYLYFYPSRVSDFPKSQSAVGLIDKRQNEWVTYLLNDECTNNPVPTPIDPCDLISENLMGYINEALKYIRIFVPILLLVLVATDFLKAAFSSTEDAMKKTQAKTIKRIVIAVIIFFVPTIVNLILNLTNDIWANINQCDINIK